MQNIVIEIMIEIGM